MVEAILTTLRIMFWLGIALGVLAVVNISTGTVNNMWAKQECFCFKKMLRGIAKVALFYICALLVSIVFTMLPFINEMITNAFGTVLLSSDLLNTLSSVGVLGVVVAAIVAQGKKAISGVISLANISSETETITWDVEDE